VAEKVVIGQVHGGWTPEEGYVAIPSGTNLYLFDDPGKPMNAHIADWGANLGSAELEEIKDSVQWTLQTDDIIQDYGLQSLRSEDVSFWDGKQHDGVTLYNEDGKHLSDVFKDHAGKDIYWFCCQSFDSLAQTPPNLQDMINEGKIKTQANGYTAAG
jgi:hypothetical protein